MPTPDSTAPTINSVALTNSTVILGDGGFNLINLPITLNLSDDISGISHWKLSYYNPSHSQSYLIQFINGDGQTSGTFSPNVGAVLGEYAEHGEYTFHSLSVYDEAGNRVSIYAHELSNYGLTESQFNFTVSTSTPTDFQVNSYTASAQDSPSVTTLTTGDFVITWQSYLQDGVHWGVFAQMYNIDGTTQGNEFQVNTYTNGLEKNPSITALTDGGFVITWASQDEDGGSSGVYAQMYNVDGTTQGGEIRVDDNNSSGNPLISSITALNDGGFVVAYTDGGSYVQIYDAYGTKQGDNFQLNTGVGGIVTLNNGSFVVTGESNDEVFAQIYNADGSAQGSEFQVNTYTTSYQNDPSITALNDGGFVITWSSYEQVDKYDVYAQIYNADGTTQGGEFQVNTFTISNQSRSSITTLTDGDFVVTWDSYNQDGTLYSIFAQMYNADGTEQGNEFHVNTNYYGGNPAEKSPSITALTDGGFIITWDSNYQDDEIYGQRYDANGNPIALEIPHNTIAFTPGANMTGTSSIDDLSIASVFADNTVGVNANGTVVIKDANGNTTTITDVEAFEFADQTFDMAGLLSDADVRPLFASPEYVGGEWVNSYIIPDVFYSGNAGLDALYDYQFFGDTGGNILVASDKNDFINGFGGDDAINTGAGNDIIDGGLGSNFLTGGTGNDTFFSDGREAGNGAITWSTVTDFTAGTNSVNIWGYIDGTSTYEWYADAGASGWTGATLHADLDGNGTIDTSMTFTGLNVSEMNAPQGLEVGGNGYLLIG